MYKKKRDTNPLNFPKKVTIKKKKKTYNYYHLFIIITNQVQTDGIICV